MNPQTLQMIDIVSLIFKDTDTALSFMRWFGNVGEEQFKTKYKQETGNDINLQPDFDNLSYEQE